ncbi:MAG: DNA/RNA nuclease SfsA [Lawsonibacter sp.]|nr:DNA/RNA nuclease SfsA [Lawsonibacter sp.]
MNYPNISSGIFLARPNRFLAYVEAAGERRVCHVKNTGRCRELLVPGCRAYLVERDNPARKTRYDLVAVEKETERGPLLVNLDSQAPNQVFGEWAAAGGFRSGLTLLRPETAYGNSRFDFYWEAQPKPVTASSQANPMGISGSEDARERGFVEVKGVTLEENGVARFPDAPTLRGVKHLEELIIAQNAGYRAAICFIVQMEGMKVLEPNDATHPQFGEALRRAARAGVSVLVMECHVTPDSLSVTKSLPIRL